MMGGMGGMMPMGGMMGMGGMMPMGGIQWRYTNPDPHPQRFSE